MSKIILKVEQRDGKARQVRYDGFVPGVMYGTGIDNGMSVKFEELELNKVLRSQGMNPRMKVILGDGQTDVLIKEVQRDPVRGNVIHVDLQAIAVDEVIRTTIPLIFVGREEIEKQALLLEVSLFEIEVSGPANIIPESISIDVGGNDAGDTVTMADIELVSGITPITPLDEVLAVVALPMAEEEEEDDAEDTDEDMDGEDSEAESEDEE
ncbi:MAG TPA: 50S ribosomal protein L25 [Clostridia bacterium]|nr:50S ribosomal protein L25 [Clostridia bacterium]